MLRAEDRGPYNRTVGQVLAKSNKLLFFSFDMVPRYIYLENVQCKHCLNPKRLALCSAMGSDRVIAKEGNSLLGLSLNRYVMTQIIYVYHFHQNQYFILRHFGEKTCRFEKTQKIFTLWHLKKYNKFKKYNKISTL